MLRCKECDVKLWCQESKDSGLCVECREGEYTGPEDLEGVLEEIGYVSRGTGE